eukprot:3156487-Rhodomonas_salina.2
MTPGTDTADGAPSGWQLPDPVAVLTHASVRHMSHREPVTVKQTLLQLLSTESQVSFQLLPASPSTSMSKQSTILLLLFAVSRRDAPFRRKGRDVGSQ